MFCKDSWSHSKSPVRYIVDLQRSGEPNQNKRFLNRRLEYAKSMHRKDLYAHYGCVNAIEFSDDGEWLVSGGDDKRVLIWNMNKALSSCPKPITMKGEHNSNIFCLSFDKNREKLFSAGNDEQVISHDVATGETYDVFLHNEAVYGISVDPTNPKLFATACDDGRILLWDTRIPTTDSVVLALYNSAFHAVRHNPAEPMLLATANAKEGVSLWDVRKPRVSLLRYGCTLWNQSAMSVRFNDIGTHILCLRRKLPPVLYELSSSEPAVSFDHKEYYNSCTMKSCCFACDDKYILSGSDDFKLYMWKIPDLTNKKGLWVNKPHAILRGHRSIVNQVRYNQTYGMLASSGVEKIIKLWSTFPVGSNESLHFKDKDGLRKVYTHEEYITLVLESGQFMTHDYSHHSMQEDPRMIAFFDSLVQRDIEGWTSDSSESGAAAAAAEGMCFEVQPSGTSSSSSSDSDVSSTSSDESHFYHFTTRSVQTQYSTGLNFSTTLCPSRPSRLGGYNSSNNKQDDSSLTSDKISELIAKKRRNQTIKIGKTTKRLKKKFIRLNGLKDSRAYGNASDVSASGYLAKNLNIRRFGKAIDKENKQCRKKFFKKLRRPVTLDTTSDSDESQAPNLSERTASLNSPSSINGEVDESEERVLSDSEQSESGTAVKKNMSTSSNALLNSSLSSNSQAINQNSNICPPEETTSSILFQPRNGKHHKRNYRKRSADDSQDD